MLTKKALWMLPLFALLLLQTQIKTTEGGATLIQEISRSSPVSTENFGYYVDISGGLLAVGIPSWNNETTTSAGLVAVYECSTSGCALLDELKNPDPQQGANFGNSVSISGSLLVVGVPNHDFDGENKPGYCYLYDCSSSPCSLVENIPNPDPGNTDFFGYATSFSGSMLVVGVWGRDTGAFFNAGASYVFSCFSSGCSMEKYLPHPDPVQNQEGFGQAVSISGTLLVIGAPNRPSGGFDYPGAAFLYDCPDYNCTLIGEISNPEPAQNDNFGKSLSFSGSLLAVGAFGKTVDQLNSAGGCYLFDCSSTNCSMIEYIPNPNPSSYSSFGYSVSFSGSLLAVGGYGMRNSAGTAFLFDCDSSGCDLVEEFYPDNLAEEDFFGWSVSISGSSLVSGAWGRGAGGSTFFYQVDSVKPTTEPPTTEPPTTQPPTTEPPTTQPPTTQTPTTQTPTTQPPTTETPTTEAPSSADKNKVGVMMMMTLTFLGVLFHLF